MVYELQEKDFAALAVFLEKSVGNRYTSEFWLDCFRLWWVDNPVQSQKYPRGWLLFHKNGEIGAFLGNIPASYHLDGKELLGYGACNWYVDETLKVKGLALFMKFNEQQGLLLNTTPTDKVVQILQRLGYQALPQEWVQEEYIFPVNIREFWALYAELQRGSKLRAALFRLIGLAGIPGLIVRQRMSRWRLSDRRPYTYHLIERFGEEYNVLWENKRGCYKMMAVRRPEWLNWYFFDSPLLRQSRRVIEIRNLSGRLCGYAGFKLVLNIQQGRSYRYFELLDALFDEVNSELIRGLFAKVYELALHEDTPIAFIKISPFIKGIARTLRKAGGIYRPGRAHYLFRPGPERKMRDWNWTEDFYATPLDGDRAFLP